MEEPYQNNSSENIESIKNVSGHFKDWFLDYASYVILERAVPALEDGLKPVHRRILHSMKEIDDGRYHKVANIIGHTMKYHPHGDTSIGDALVHIGQKNLLIDTQGNWGNIFTGDRAAASRYIEARLTPFALETLFNHKITNWLSSYDGRGKEPEVLPAKYPILLYHGVEGIAVGLSTKVMPHNFNELIDASIAILKNRSFKLVPDFPTAGLADFSNYNDGKKGGKIKVRARISIEDNKTLKISEIPFGTTTSSLIDSILKANDKGKIKIKKVEDNTAEHVEILVHLAPNISPDQMIDALYAFTDCEVNISVYCCVVHEDKPVFIGVSDILRFNTQNTVDLLTSELKIKLGEAKEQWHFSSLEKIFIENRIYLRIEEAETWEEIIQEIRTGLEPFIGNLERAVTDDDIARLTEIKIKRISKYDSFKAEENILKIEGKIAEYQHHLTNIIDYTIDFFKNIKEKYGKGRERKTEITNFGTIQANRVAIASEKLYVNREEGFVGTGSSMRKEEYVCDCSDIDDIIVFRKDGTMVVSKVDDKKFLGKDILYVNVFKKGNTRKIYNVIYEDGATKFTYQKRFAVKTITRDKEYRISSDHKKSKILYFSANPNGEAELVEINLKTQSRTRKLKFELNFADLAIKGRGVKGNLVSKFPIKKIEFKAEGNSTLEPVKIWLDESIMRLNREERGELLGAFGPKDKLIEITDDGKYRVITPDLTTHFESNWLKIEKWHSEKPITAVYYYPEKEKHYIKRFVAEPSSKPFTEFLPDEKCRLEFVSTAWKPQFQIHFRKQRGKDLRESETIIADEFIEIKGFSAMGNQLSGFTIKDVEELESIPYEEPQVEIEEEKETPTLFDEMEGNPQEE
ncbi:MAG: DNA gyrase/topoisomerase IV subunit A [Flavobacteriales bacterium]|jgi:topoisomerase-4 subunit A|nr:DNA gyrase/topoisomerase IV subunit A [Flavobacteriales bacterium]